MFVNVNWYFWNTINRHLSSIDKDVCVRVCVCVCVCVCVHVYVVYEDTHLYNDIGIT